MAILLLLPAAIPAQETLDQLLQEVRAARQQIGVGQKQLLDNFANNPESQASLLAQARAELVRLQKKNADLEERRLEQARLIEQAQPGQGSDTEEMDAIFAAVRDFAADAATGFKNSLVSAQLGERTDLLSELSRADIVASPEQLRALQALLLQEMVQSGKVVRFESEIIDAAGHPQGAEVVRVGMFNLISGDSYLRFAADDGVIQALPGQPPQQYRRLAGALSVAQAGILPMAIDPTAGQLLNLMLRSPPWSEQIAQGGLVAYLILLLGALGLLIALYRLIYLQVAGSRIKAQLRLGEARKNNALGRVLHIYADNPDADTETLELRLDEAILQETPKLEKWQAALKVIAAVAPLLGLLGTVIGMIETFQQITLFGSGDPRMMADGISKALVTTMLGLLVAIPVVLLHSMVASRSRQLIEILEQQSAGIIAEQAEKRQ